jgi:hypothetical protein
MRVCFKALLLLAFAIRAPAGDAFLLLLSRPTLFRYSGYRNQSIESFEGFKLLLSLTLSRPTPVIRVQQGYLSLSLSLSLARASLSNHPILARLLL